MVFNYSKLDGKITERFGTRYAFSHAMGFSERTMSLKMSGQVPWKQPEMAKACELLGIHITDISAYFFAV